MSGEANVAQARNSRQRLTIDEIRQLRELVRACQMLQSVTIKSKVETASELKVEQKLLFDKIRVSLEGLEEFPPIAEYIDKNNLQAAYEWFCHTVF